MCGIAGTFAYHLDAPPVDREALLCTRDHMRTRGPDGEGLWIDKDQRIGLAHRRLAIIDLSPAGAQPMCDAQTGNQIVFNGEIYNYQLLRKELEDIGHNFISHSDTEVLLKLYAAHGQEMLHKLRGMYAFTIWDQAKQGLFLARDPFGIKPLYLADDGKTLHFASQVKALLAGNAADTTREPAGHVGFFLWGHVPEPYTLYKGIRALPAGVSLWVDRAQHKVHEPFFNLAQALAPVTAESGIIEPGEAHELLRAALLDTVRHHLVADVPVGVFLSAGLDSTTLTALATEVLNRSRHSGNGVAQEGRLRTLTLGFKEFATTENDEVPLAESVAKLFNTAHTTRWVKKEDFAEQLDNILAAMDQPSIDGINSYFVSLAAKEAGLKVALSGLGGDELFAGYTHFRDIPRMVRLLRSASYVPFIGRGFRRIAAPLLKHLTSPKSAGLLEYGGDYAGAYLLRRGLFMPWELPEVLDGELVREGWRELQTLPALHSTIVGVDHPRLRVGALETAWYMRNQLLRDTDWASMAHSLEVRVPLVDIQLFRTVTRLVHTGRAPSKQEMAASPALALPEPVLNRKKTGFSIPAQDWIKISMQSSETQQRGYRAWAISILSPHGNI